MPFHSVLVRKIRHLTDARYFAAMGVDWMSMELNDDPASFMRWHTLRDWVEGVKLVAEINLEDEMLLARAIIDAKPAGIFIHHTTGIDIPNDVIKFFDVHSPLDVPMDPSEMVVISYVRGVTDLGQIGSIQPDKIFLQSDWTRESLTEILSNGYEGGICFSGGVEEMTGMRDYGEVDDMMSALGRI